MRQARGSGRWEEKESQTRGPLAQPLRLLPATRLRRAGGRLANLAGAQNLHGRTQVSERVAMPGRMAGLMASRGWRIERQSAERTLPPAQGGAWRWGEEAQRAAQHAGRARGLAIAGQPGTSAVAYPRGARQGTADKGQGATHKPELPLVIRPPGREDSALRPAQLRHPGGGRRSMDEIIAAPGRTHARRRFSRRPA